LVGHTEEMKAGISRTLQSGSLQEPIDLEEYELRVVIHPTRIKGEIYFGQALYAKDLASARLLPGFRPFGAESQKVVIHRKRRTRGEVDPVDPRRRGREEVDHAEI